MLAKRLDAPTLSAYAPSRSRCAHALLTRVLAGDHARSTLAHPSVLVLQCSEAESASLKATTAAAGVAAAGAVAAPAAANAACEVAEVATGEPGLVKLGWAAVLASFSFSISLVVWGRSGL